MGLADELKELGQSLKEFFSSLSGALSSEKKESAVPVAGRFEFFADLDLDSFPNKIFKDVRKSRLKEFLERVRKEGVEGRVIRKIIVVFPHRQMSNIYNIRPLEKKIKQELNRLLEGEAEVEDVEVRSDEELVSWMREEKLEPPEKVPEGKALLILAPFINYSEASPKLLEIKIKLKGREEPKLYYYHEGQGCFVIGSCWYYNVFLPEFDRYGIKGFLSFSYDERRGFELVGGPSGRLQLESLSPKEKRIALINPLQGGGYNNLMVERTERKKNRFRFFLENGEFEFVLEYRKLGKEIQEYPELTEEEETKYMGTSTLMCSSPYGLLVLLGRLLPRPDYREVFSYTLYINSKGKIVSSSSKAFKIKVDRNELVVYQQDQELYRAAFRSDINFAKGKIELRNDWVKEVDDRQLDEKVFAYLRLPGETGFSLKKGINLIGRLPFNHIKLMDSFSVKNNFWRAYSSRIHAALDVISEGRVLLYNLSLSFPVYVFDSKYKFKKRIEPAVELGMRTTELVNFIQRSSEEKLREEVLSKLEAFELDSGDIIAVGNTVFMLVLSTLPE